MYLTNIYWASGMSPTHVLEIYQSKRCGPWDHGIYRLVMRRVSVGAKGCMERFIPVPLLHVSTAISVSLSPAQDVRTCVNTEVSKFTSDFTCGILEKKSLPGKDWKERELRIIHVWLWDGTVAERFLQHVEKSVDLSFKEGWSFFSGHFTAEQKYILKLGTGHTSH